jgi:Periplasmic copper-binding protein (NosD)
MKSRCLLLAFAIGLALTLLLLVAIAPSSDTARASPGILYASLTCGSPIPEPCYTSIQAAINAALDGDTIRVIQGTYLETVVLTKSLTLEGGWPKDMLGRDWNIYTTTIDAHRSGSAIRIKGNISPTIEGFIVTGGDASSYLGWGGGVLADGVWEEGGLVTIRHNVITNNIACNGSVSCQGYGGGIMVYSNRAILEYNTIISNAARTGGNGSGRGGGLSLWGYPSEVTLTGNVIVSNTAVFSPTGLYSAGEGGGVWAEGACDILALDNEIRANIAAAKGDGYGGGVYACGDWYDNRILSNTASIGGTGFGGGVYAGWVQNFDDNLVQDNVASLSADGTGGGIYANQLQNAKRNTVTGNTAQRGGGVHLSSSSRTELRDNWITHNHATGALGNSDGGGGIASADNDAQIVNNNIFSNTAAYFGGGLLVTASKQYKVQGNTLQGNTASYGGGVLVYSATGVIAGNLIANNTAQTRGGGLYLYQYVTATLDANRILSNTSLGEGGGIAIRFNSFAVTMTNHMIAHNSAALDGGGMYVYASNAIRFINNTLVDNNQGSGKVGVALFRGLPVTLTNNIIVGHSVAISVAAGSTAVLTCNDYWDNTIGVSGQISGATDMTLDPQFENRAAGDYHLALNSAVIDLGDNSVNVPLDFEGDPRPRGGKMDVGADEAYRSETYVSQVTGSDLTGIGSAIQPFATVTKGVGETRTGGTVYAGRGHYTERITLTRSVNLLGGYRESDWTRSITTYSTTLDAARTGTVVLIRGEGVRATLEGFTVTGGEASTYGSGGGVYVGDDAVATIRYNTITGNHAQNGGGGLMVWGNESIPSLIDSNRIYNNTADGEFVPLSAGPSSPQQGPEPGGGLFLAGPARLVNNWVYSNTSAVGGDGIALMDPGPMEIYHNTVADNGGDNGVGIELRGGAIYLYNNLIVGHGTGITTTDPTQTAWDYNGFYDNQTAYGHGLIVGPHDVMGDPCFINRAAGDYDISVASPMAGAGTTVDVALDMHGDPRPAPAGTLPDLGADEVSQQHLYLPIVLRN